MITLLQRIRVHDFRHSCASLLINKSSTIALVAKYLGHSNISVTLNPYTHIYEKLCFEEYMSLFVVLRNSIIGFLLIYAQEKALF